VSDDANSRIRVTRMMRATLITALAALLLTAPARGADDYIGSVTGVGRW